MTALPIFASGDVRTAWATDSVLASLPVSYCPSPTLAGSVAVVGGTAGWPIAVAAAIENGSTGVLVVAPEPADLTRLRDLDHRCPIVIDSVWASNPVIPAAAAAIRSSSSGSRLECRVFVGSKRPLDAVLVDQLSLVRAVLSPATGLRMLHRSDSGYTAEADTTTLAVDLTAVRTDALPAHALLRLITADGSVEVQIPDGHTARPALITVTGPAGATLSPTVYETGHRATWRRLHRLLTDHESSHDIDDLEADIRTASA